MAVTFFRRVEEKPLSVYSDGTYAYVGTSRGRILKITISNGTKATLKWIRGCKVTALCSDGTSIYAGDNKGRLHQIVIATAALTTLESDLRSPILSASISATTIVLTLANGKLYTRSVA